MPDEDLKFISGNFSEIEIPKNYKFLLKYFTTAIQIAFVKYFWLFRDWSNFVDHTGFYCTQRYLRKQADMFAKLMQIYEENAGRLDEKNMRIIQQLNEGKFKI